MRNQYNIDAARTFFADQPRPATPVGRVLSKYERYEADKALWSRLHPDATPSEYEQAMREIARIHGV